MNGEIRDRQILCNIARCAFEVVNRLLSRDQQLARELRSSTTGSRQIYREECITLDMVAELRERFPEHVEITVFTPPEETRTGADWYWRFEKDSGAIHARVQAKRVQRTAFGQPDNQGHVDLDLQQLQQLVAATGNVPKPLTGLQAWLATFARFDATPPCGISDLKLCRNHSHHGPCADCEPSLWIAHAREIGELQRERVPVREIVEHSLRLDCILPCIDGQYAGVGPASKEFFIQGSLSSYQDCISSIEADAQLRSEFEGALRIKV